MAFSGNSINLKSVIYPHFFDIYETVQREFVWTHEIDKLLNDIDERSFSEKIFSIGKMDFYSKGTSGRLSIIDGQQRLVTIMIFIANIIQRLDSLGKENESMKEICNNNKLLLNDYLCTRELASQTTSIVNNYRIKLPDADDDIFRAILSNKLSDDNRKNKLLGNGSKNLIAACDRCKKFVDQKSFDDIFKIISYLLNDVIVFPYTTDDIDIANDFANSANNRGRNWTDDQVIRLFFIKKFKEESQQTITRKKMDDIFNLNNIVGSEMEFYSRYLMSYGINTYNFKTSKRGIAGHFENELSKKNVNEVENLIANLSKYARWYNKLSRGEYNILPNFNKQFPTNMLYPINLAMIDVYGENHPNVFKICQVLERIILVGYFHDDGYFLNHKVEEICSTAKFIRDNRQPEDVLKIVDEVLKIAGTKYDEALSFMYKFKFSTPNIQKYYISLLTNYLNVTNSDIETIEHILPKTIEKNEYWYKRFSSEDHFDYLNLLGNLTPILKSENSSLQNVGMIHKRDVYKKSNYNLTKSLDDKLETNIGSETILAKRLKEFNYMPPENRDKWDKEEIDKRTKCMIDLLISLIFKNNYFLEGRNHG